MEASHLDGLLTEDQAMIAQAVGEFATDVVLPRHERLDHTGEFPAELWGQIAELGLFGAFVPEDLGGAGAGLVGHVVVVETLARAAGIAGFLACAHGIVTDAVVASGDDEAQGQWLEGLATGETIGAPAMSEEDWAVDCSASGDGADVTLSGTKLAVPFAGHAGCYLVRAQRGDDDVLAMVAPDASGLVHGPIDAIGMRGGCLGTLTLDGTPGRVIGGADLVERVMSGARIASSALLAGLCRGALDHAVRYSGERKQFKLELRRFGAIQDKLVTGDAKTEAVRGLVHGAARLADGGQAFAQAARRARHLASEAARTVTDDCVQVYGGYGYSREYPVERFYRDAMFCGFGEYHLAALLAESTQALD